MRILRYAIALLALFAIVGVGIVLSKPAMWILPQRTDEWKDRHAEKREEAKQRAGQVDLVFIGDSVTKDYENTAIDPYFQYHEIWNDLFAPHRAMNLGFNGDRTFNATWALRHGELDGLTPKDVVLQIGTTDLVPRFMRKNGESAPEVLEGIMGVIAEVHRQLPNAHLLVLSLLPGNFSADRTARVDYVNAHLATQVPALPYARWLDLTDIFMDGTRLRSEYFVDLFTNPRATALHPSAPVQRIIAERIAQALYGH